MFSLKKEIAKDIDKKDDRVRKNHNLVYFPDIASVKKFNARLEAIGNIKSDGRPILGLDAADLLKIMLDVNDNGFFVPAHIWTPWFSMFGSKSGFDSMEECFGPLKKHIFAVETGLSSDPSMNWRIEDLDNVRLLSNSDAHSPGYLGRNASVFNTDLSFFDIRQALERNDLEKFKGTLDMYPHQGKYHYDGHRKCNICLNPADTAQIDGICPECGRKLTLGVLNRVQELSTRQEGYVPENRHGFKSIVPLADILSEIFEVGPKTKKVAAYYTKAIETLGPELDILVNKSIEEIDAANVPLLSQAVMKMRAGDLNIDPGYDGEFGKVKLFSRKEKERLKGEKNLLFDLPGRKNKKKEKKNVVKNKIKGKISKKNQKKIQAAKPKGLLEGLNPEQKKAVESSTRAMVIQAGPGTGKTLTLTAKIAYLVSKKNIEPGNILALTFTNRAARELEQRINQYMPKTESQVLAATFHSFCLKLLKDYKGFNAAIAEESLRVSLIKEAIGKEAKRGVTNKIDQYISLCKQNLMGPDDDFKTLINKVEPGTFKKYYRAYQALCQEQNVVDFEDLILMTVNMLSSQEDILSWVKDQYQYIFIDEYQDLNGGQYKLIKMISKGNHIVVIGDPDQSIYGFRGSDNKYFNRFSNDFLGCEKIILKQNYRSTQTILDASFQMINKSLDKDEKSKIFTDVKSTKKLIIKEMASEQAEAVTIGKMIEKLVGGTSFFSMDAGIVDLNTQREYSFADFAILCRTRRQCDTFITAFEKAGIPFQAADKKSQLEMNGIKQLISLCRVMAKNESFQDIENIVHYLDTDIDRKEMVQLYKFYKKSCSLKQDIIESLAKKDNNEFKDATKTKMNAIAKIFLDLRDKIKNCDNKTSIRILYSKIGLKDIIENDDKIKQVFENLISKAGLYHDLNGFLYGLCLNRDVDVMGFNIEKVSLMTMHAAKGLEFPVVFVTGCEQGLIPFAKDGKNIDNLEEERRLFYVAMTRAMDILCLTYAKKRSIYGKSYNRLRSLFIGDIEKSLTQVEKSPVIMSVTKNEKQLELF